MGLPLRPVALWRSQRRVPANNATYTYGAPGAAFNRAGRAFRIQAESGVRQMDFGPLGEVSAMILMREINGAW